MKNYRGYNVGKGVNDFHSEKEVDEFIKSQTIKRFIQLNKKFNENPTMELSSLCSDYSLKLNQLGLSWEEIEELENSCF